MVKYVEYGHVCIARSVEQSSSFFNRSIYPC
jgi:hypothetical protein